MEICLDWLRLVKPDDAKIIWLRAEGHRWRRVCIEDRLRTPDRLASLGGRARDDCEQGEWAAKERGEIGTIWPP